MVNHNPVCPPRDRALPRRILDLVAEAARNVFRKWKRYCFTVASVHCRNTGHRRRRALLARGTLVVSILGLVGLPASAAGATVSSTPTTLPGPAPNQAQINAAQSQVSAI